MARPSDIAFGKRVRSLRQAKRMTQAALAEELGVSAQVISRWERGEEGIPEERRRSLSGVFSGLLDGLVAKEDAEPLPEVVEDWMDFEEWSSTSTRSRIAIACVLAYELQSYHVRRFCLQLATAIDSGRIGIDEALVMVRVDEPAILQQPTLEGLSLEEPGVYILEKVNDALMDSWVGVEGRRKREAGDRWVDLLRDDERVYAEDRVRDALRRIAERAKPKQKERSKEQVDKSVRKLVDRAERTRRKRGARRSGNR